MAIFHFKYANLNVICFKKINPCICIIIYPIRTFINVFDRVW